MQAIIVGIRGLSVVCITNVLWLCMPETSFQCLLLFALASLHIVVTVKLKRSSLLSPSGSFSAQSHHPSVFCPRTTDPGTSLALMMAVIPWALYSPKRARFHRVLLTMMGRKAVSGRSGLQVQNHTAYRFDLLPPASHLYFLLSALSLLSNSSTQE